MARKAEVIVIHERDNVATALKPLSGGSTVSIRIQNRSEKIRLASDIPMGHKFALSDIEKGAPVVKYGEPIGETTCAIRRGEHVHVHNMMSRKKGSTTSEF